MNYHVLLLIYGKINSNKKLYCESRGNIFMEYSIVRVNKENYALFDELFSFRKLAIIDTEHVDMKDKIQGV